MSYLDHMVDQGVEMAAKVIALRAAHVKLWFNLGTVPQTPNVQHIRSSIEWLLICNLQGGDYVQKAETGAIMIDPNSLKYGSIHFIVLDDYFQRIRTIVVHQDGTIDEVKLP